MKEQASDDLTDLIMQVLTAATKSMQAIEGKQSGKKKRITEERRVSKENKDVVVFYRYIRPHKGQNPEFGGVVLRFEVNYVHRTVNVSFSVCHNDLFDLERGRALAEETSVTRGIRFHYPETGFDSDGIVGYFVREVLPYCDLHDHTVGLIASNYYLVKLQEAVKLIR